MRTTVTEIGNRIYRFSTFFPDMIPGGFTFNQFLVDADEPLLYHCGMRGLFESVSHAVATVMPLQRLRWISFGHVEADECGAMNQWLAACPHAQVIHGEVGCDVSIRDLADRPPRALAHDQVLDLGGRRVRLQSTPHVPHAWEAIALYEETTRTLFCGDLGTHTGDGPALTDRSIVEPALQAESLFHASALTAQTAPTIRRLAALEPVTLAIMHGSSFTGAAGDELHQLADGYQRLFEESIPAGTAH